jgi:hypothetical protein
MERKCGVRGWVEEIYVIQGRFCKKVLRILVLEANGVAELEMYGDSRSGKILCLAVTYCLRIV